MKKWRHLKMAPKSFENVALEKMAPFKNGAKII